MQPRITTAITTPIATREPTLSLAVDDANGEAVASTGLDVRAPLEMVVADAVDGLSLLFHASWIMGAHSDTVE